MNNCLYIFAIGGILIDSIITLLRISGPPKPESSHHQDWSRGCQIKPQYMPTSPYTVFIHKPSIQRNCIYVRCCISFGICCRLYWGDQVIEYKYVVNLHWGLSLRDLSVFFSFWNFYLNNASSVGQTRCHRSNHLCLSVSSSTQQPMFESMEPAKYIFHHTTPSDVLYLIRKSGGEKPAYNKMKLWHLLGIIMYLSICHWRNWKLRIFSCIKLTTWTYLKCAKSYLSSLVNVNT